MRDHVRDMACLDRHITKMIARVQATGGAPVDLQALFAMLTIDTISVRILLRRGYILGLNS